MGVPKREILQLGAISIFIVTALITVAMLFTAYRDAVSPHPSKFLLREFIFVAERLNLTFRIDEKIYVNFDEYLVVFSGMARDSSGRMLPQETAIPGSIVGSREGLIARGAAGGRVYWAVGRHPNEVREVLASTLKERADWDPLSGDFLDAAVGPGGIGLPRTALSELNARFGRGTASGKGCTAWKLPQLQLTACCSESSQSALDSVESIRFSHWKGTLNSALLSSGLSRLPGPLGELLCGAPSGDAKRTLGLAELEGTVKFCPAMVPQKGKTDVFCRLGWDLDAKLAAVQFSSAPFWQGKLRGPRSDDGGR